MKKRNSTRGSGNVFVDLGFDPVEAHVLQIRADLMSDLRMYIRNHKMSQAEAARVFGVTQSRVSDLVRGKWAKFSLEMLMTLEGRLGRRVDVKVAA